MPLRRSNILLGLLALFAALTLDSCRSSRIESSSTNSALSTRRSDVMELLTEAETRVGVSSYSAKNAKTQVVYAGNSVKVKANISFKQGGDTKIAARLAFPPVSVGTITVTSKKATISSKYINADKSINLPSFANEILQSAMLGNLPPVYKYFGDTDFRNFQMYLNSDDTYELSRSEAGTSVRIGINGVERTLAYVRVTFGKVEANLEVDEYQRFDGKLLPKVVKVDAREGKTSSATKLDIEITDVTLQ